MTRTIYLIVNLNKRNMEENKLITQYIGDHPAIYSLTSLLLDYCSRVNHEMQQQLIAACCGI